MARVRDVESAMPVQDDAEGVCESDSTRRAIMKARRTVAREGRDSRGPALSGPARSFLEQEINGERAADEEQ
jgi:hypothetical protein